MLWKQFVLCNGLNDWHREFCNSQAHLFQPKFTDIPTVLPAKSLPLLLLDFILIKLFGKHYGRLISRQIGFSPCECLLHRLREKKSPKRKIPRQLPKIIKVLHSAVCDSQLHHRFELLGNDTFFWVRQQFGRRKIEQSREYRLCRRRGNHIPEPNINLN